MASGHDDGFVSGDSGHGREGIHGLRPGYPGNQLHGKGGQLLLHDGREARRIVQGLEEANHY